MSKSIIGYRYHKLIILEQLESLPNHKSTRWLCQCDCGKQIEVSRSNLKKDFNAKGGVKSCGCLVRRRREESPHWKGVGEISSTIFKKYKTRAKQRKMQFSVTHEFLWKLFLKQNRRCALSNEILMFPSTHVEKVACNYTASLDRINNDKGYIKDNVQWVHKHINMMKHKYTQEYFISVCKKVAEWQKQVEL